MPESLGFPSPVLTRRFGTQTRRASSLILITQRDPTRRVEASTRRVAHETHYNYRNDIPQNQDVTILPHLI